MATLQKFKLLATQCATAASSPSRSPIPAAASTVSKSPSFHLRRRNTLKRLLNRSSSSSRRFLRRGEPSGANQASDRGERKGLLSHTSLKDLFVSSSPPPLEGGDSGCGAGAARIGGGEVEYGYPAASASRGVGRRFGFEGIGGGFAARRSGGGGAARFGSMAALRYRLLRKVWRPVLLTIPE